MILLISFLQRVLVDWLVILNHQSLLAGNWTWELYNTFKADLQLVWPYDVIVLREKKILRKKVRVRNRKKIWLSERKNSHNHWRLVSDRGNAYHDTVVFYNRVFGGRDSQSTTWHTRNEPVRFVVRSFEMKFLCKMGVLPIRDSGLKQISKALHGFPFCQEQQRNNEFYH